MAVLKHALHNLSLRQSIACYIAAFALLAFLLSLATSVACTTVKETIEAQYPVPSEKFYLTTASGQRLGEGVYISTVLPDYSPQHARLLTVLDLLPTLAVPIYSALCLLAAILLFYRNKLQQPLTLLEQAAQKISARDLDFTIHYDNGDELGHLCRSFETMRAALLHSYRQLWQQMDQRKRLNAAFAHDLRTPLTVLKGYNQMLQENSQAQTRETAAVMEHQLLRLEAYVDSMGQLQRLEDYALRPQPVLLAEACQLWQQTAQLYCQQQQKTLQWQTHCRQASMALDCQLITQVLDNLLANAARYARQTITVTLQDDESASGSQPSLGLLLTVADDGPGFSAESLQKATEPYYTEQKQKGQHFGLGLTICHILSQRHNGWLTVGNTPQGAQVTAFFAAEQDEPTTCNASTNGKTSSGKL